MTGLVALVTDDGTPLTPLVCQLLLSQGWKVMTLTFPETVVEAQSLLPEQTGRVVLDRIDLDRVDNAIATIENFRGPIRGFVHLHPPPNPDGDPEITAERDQAIVDGVRLVTRRLAGSIGATTGTGRAFFLAVTHGDGGPDRPETPGDLPPEAHGQLRELVSTLHPEWSATLCRALDLSPLLDVETQAGCIAAELNGTDRDLTDVGYDPRGRWTPFGEDVNLTAACVLPTGENAPSISDASVKAHRSGR